MDRDRQHLKNKKKAIENYLENIKKPIVLSPDIGFYSMLIQGYKIYNQQGINSGTILFDTSFFSEQLFENWYYVFTNKTY